EARRTNMRDRLSRMTALLLATGGLVACAATNEDGERSAQTESAIEPSKGVAATQRRFCKNGNDKVTRLTTTFEREYPATLGELQPFKGRMLWRVHGRSYHVANSSLANDLWFNDTTTETDIPKLTEFIRRDRAPWAMAMTDYYCAAYRGGGSEW